MLYLVVTNKNGTGKKAKNFDYPIGGKTGTAHKVVGGQYSSLIKLLLLQVVFQLTNQSMFSL